MAITNENLIKVGQHFIQHFKANGYTLSFVEYEAGLPSATVKSLVEGRYKGPSQRTAEALKTFMEAYDKDAAFLRGAAIEDILLSPIRILHLGKRYEQALLSGDVETVQDLILKDTKVIASRCHLGKRGLKKLEDLLSKRGLKMGMDFDPCGESSTTITLNIAGTRGQVQAAISSVSRHIRNRLDVEDVDVKIKADEIKERSEEEPKVKGKNFPFMTQFRIACGNRKMEASNKKFRTGSDLADFLENVAKKIRPITDAKSFENSDVWAVEIR